MPEWVDIADTDANPASMVLPDFVGTASVAGRFVQGWVQGGLRMARGEGIRYHSGKLFIVDAATAVNAADEGGNGEGALWDYDLAKGMLKAVFVSLNGQWLPANRTTSRSARAAACCFAKMAAVSTTKVIERFVGLTSEGASFGLARHNIRPSAGRMSDHTQHVDSQALGLQQMAEPQDDGLIRQAARVCSLDAGHGNPRTLQRHGRSQGGSRDIPVLLPQRERQPVRND
jgi:hypothetical protein